MAEAIKSKDEIIADEKLKNIHLLFKANFENISKKLDEVIAHQKVTNGRVNTLESNHAVDINERGHLSAIIKKVSTTLDKVDKKLDDFEKAQIINETDHENIHKKLDNISECIETAKKRGLGFWLWLSENKLRLAVIFIPAVLAIFPETRQDMLDFVKSIFSKIF